MSKHDDESPGTSDRGQLTACRSPFLANVKQHEEPYTPPPAPGPGETGPMIARSPARIEQKLAYRELAAVLTHDGDGSNRIAEAAEAAAAKVRRG